MTDVRGSRITRMMDDPDLGGDLLLIGLGFARFLDFGLPPGKKLSTGLVARAAFPSVRYRGRKVKSCLEDDARTYVPPARPWNGECGAPMVRRAGTCGRDTSQWGDVTDWRDGELTWIGACYRHRDWLDATCQANQEAKPRRLVVPPANNGGILACHIPEFAWPKIWAWASDGRWFEHPEVEPWKPPTFTLHLGDGEATAAAARPLLAPVGAF